MTAANVFGAQYYLLEQLGFRKLVDTTFMMGFLVAEDADREDIERYFRALRRAQREIDLEPERYKHYWPREMPEDLRDGVDVRRFGPGERIVFEPYTREMFERTHRWMRALGAVRRRPRPRGRRTRRPCSPDGGPSIALTGDRRGAGPLQAAGPGARGRAERLLGGRRAPPTSARPRSPSTSRRSSDSSARSCSSTRSGPSTSRRPAGRSTTRQARLLQESERLGPVGARRPARSPRVVSRSAPARRSSSRLLPCA